MKELTEKQIKQQEEYLKELMRVPFKRKLYDFFDNIKWFFKNLITFRKVLTMWRPYDGVEQISLFKFGLKELGKYIDESKSGDKELNEKKVKEINLAIYLIENYIRRSYDDKCNYGYSKWAYDALGIFLVGQNPDDFYKNAKFDDASDETEQFKKWFNGTGISNWWV